MTWRLEPRRELDQFGQRFRLHCALSPRHARSHALPHITGERITRLLG
jgi:hypothetical protein